MALYQWVLWYRRSDASDQRRGFMLWPTSWAA